LAWLQATNPGANLTTSEFTTTTPGSWWARAFHQCMQNKIICFQNAQGYSWRCNFFQRWRYKFLLQWRCKFLLHWRCKFLQRWLCKSLPHDRRIGSRNLFPFKGQSLVWLGHWKSGGCPLLYQRCRPTAFQCDQTISTNHRPILFK
jgi:hypothetical protein